MSLSRDSGIPCVGTLPFGTHFCQFYRTREDLADTLVSYFEAGLRNGEACMWVTSDPLPAHDARELMAKAVPGFQDFLASGQIEILGHDQWYLENGQSAEGVLRGWLERERRALDRGYQGLRLTGNTFWLERGSWADFMDYEAEVNSTFSRFRIIGLCTYCLDRCRADDVIDVCRHHQFALARRQGEWELLESASLKIAKDDLKRLNEELEQRVAERTAVLENTLRGRDEFLAMLAHELRNPLAPIRNATQVMRQLGSGDQSAVWARDVIERQVHQLSHLVDDLLDVSRITRGRIRLDRREVDLATVLAQALETSRPLIDSRGHALTVTLPPEPLFLDVDLTRISQAVANLLNNAAKYMEEGGQIWLTAEREGEEAVIRVRDRGVGIPPEMLSRVFELFTQLDRSLDRSEGGLGVGLALVRGLVELHGGSVEALSEGSGRGSELVVRLPVVRVGPVPAAEASPGCQQKPDSDKAGRRILVVDDNEDAAETLGMFLELSGYEVHIAHDGEEALREAELRKPEIVLLDIGLPKLDGYEVARRLRAGGGPQLIIAISGYGRDEDRGRGMEAGVDRYLVKPVDPAALLRELEAAKPS
jgi:signal transduction histidine kinase